MRSSISPWWLVLLFFLTLAIRLAVLASDLGSLDLDNDSYARLAINWAHSGTYGFAADNRDGALPEIAVTRPTAYRPPVYPWVLSWMVERGQLNTMAVATLHLVLGVATVLLVYVVAVRIGLDWPFLPALSVACDPILLRGSQLVMTETLITFLAVVVWLFWLYLIRPVMDNDGTRFSKMKSAIGGALLLGVLLGVAVLTRPTMLPWAVCAIMFLTFRWPDSSKRFSVLTASTLMFLAVLVPWAARNARAFGQPIWTTTHGGYTLLLANNPSLYDHFKRHGPSRAWDATDFHRRWALRRSGDASNQSFWKEPLTQIPAEPPIDELIDDRLAQRAAIATIAREPSVFALSCLYRVGWLWAVHPNEVSARPKWAIGIWYTYWFILAAIGSLRIGSKWLSQTWLLPAALLVTLTGIHAIYWSNMRMRAPIMPIVYVVAALPLMRQRSTL